MRVLFWSEHFWPYMGGAEVWGLRLVLALRDRGYEFFVVTSHDYLCLLYTSPSPRDRQKSRMPSSA